MSGTGQGAPGRVEKLLALYGGHTGAALATARHVTSLNQIVSAEYTSLQHLQFSWTTPVYWGPLTVADTRNVLFIKCSARGFPHLL